LIWVVCGEFFWRLGFNRVVLKAVIGLISMMVFVVWSSVGWGLGSVIFGGSRVFGGVCGVVIFLKFEFKVLMALY